MPTKVRPHRDDGSYGVRAALDLLPPRQGGIALDLGSGSGRIAALVAQRGYAVRGCEDISERAQAAAAFSGAVVDAVSVMDWEPSPVPVDLVTCIELIEHLPADDQRLLLQRIHGWLRDDGRLVLSTPQRHSPVALVERLVARLRGQEYHWWDPTHIGILRQRDIVALVNEAGFRIEARLGAHLVAGALGKVVPPLRRWEATLHRGPLSRLGFDLIYILAKSEGSAR